MTPGPWFIGYWGGVCRNPEHVAARSHPGPPKCVYDPVRHDYNQASGSFLGIASENGVDVISSRDGELSMSIEDARLIAAAPDLLVALASVVEFVQHLDHCGIWRRRSDTVEAQREACDCIVGIARAALAKATGVST